MCDDHAMVLDDDPPSEPVSRHGQLTRRKFMQGAAAAATGWMLPSLGIPRPAFASAADGTIPYSMAMHVHSSFSEQSGSMQSQLAQALSNSVNVLWMTDHDDRMMELGYRRVVHFTSLTNETTDGSAWQWQRRVAGPLAATSAGGIVTSPASPNDTVAGGSLAVKARSTTGSRASLGYFAQSKPAGWNYHCNLYGQTWTIDVLPSSIGRDGYLELLISSSHHLASGGRPAGIYSLSYRFGGGGTPGGRVVNGTQGIVYVGVTAGRWNTVTLTPTDDIAALWPDMQAHDFASSGLTLSAVSTGALASGNFDYLRFGRQYNTGNIPVQTQADLMRAYAPAYLDVVQHQGLEISGPGVGLKTHVNWFGGPIRLPDYSGVTSSKYLNFLREQVASIHANSGVASYNHPFGYSIGPELTLQDQDAQLSQVAANLLANNMLDCDILEVGYPLRGGCNLTHHAALWDVLSRNGRFTTGNGVNDDHLGENWFGIKNNWYTSAWAASTTEADLVSALKAGRAYTASLSRFRGTLDLHADGTCPMGSASTSQLPNRRLQITATDLPQGGSLQVLQGTCDYTGTTPNTAQIRRYSDVQLVGGSAILSVDTSSSSFVRTQVLDSAGQVVALSNPVWLLRESPPKGIPPARSC